jgi:hypothetical protein
VWEHNDIVSHLLYRYIILAGAALTTGEAGLGGAILLSGFCSLNIL